MQAGKIVGGDTGVPGGRPRVGALVRRLLRANPRMSILVESSIAGEPPTLEPAFDVQARLEIDARAYERLVARFSALVASVTDALAPDACATDESLLALAEAALLVGARRVTTALARLRAAEGDARPEAVRALQCELRRVAAAIAAV